MIIYTGFVHLEAYKVYFCTLFYTKFAKDTKMYFFVQFFIQKYTLLYKNVQKLFVHFYINFYVQFFYTNFYFVYKSVQELFGVKMYAFIQ